MTEREAEIACFLAAHGWSDASRVPLAGDASSRRYERLRGARGQTILMDAPPGPDTARFVRIAQWLQDRGYSAPAIVAGDPGRGLLLLEDFGDALAASELAARPQDEPEFYARVTDFLLDLGRHQPPTDLTLLDGAELGRLAELARAWYPVLSADAAQAVPALIAERYEALTQEAPVLCLRDFHALNVILLDRPGHRALGLLDFQDAVRAHPAYDLVSALQDARRDVPQVIEARERARFAQASGIDPARFDTIYALLGAQRALRILGIFARLGRSMGKPHYLSLMPRVWGYLQRNLDHPGLAGIARTLRAAHPAPDPSIVERMMSE